MKKVISCLLIAVFVFSNCIVAKGATKDIDKLYSDAYEAVSKCEYIYTQVSVNSAREAIKKLVGVVDWAVGEFSKKVDMVQHYILVEIVDGIEANKESPVQYGINELRNNINELPVDSWRRSYSSALDIAQNILIKDAVDTTNYYKKDKSNEARIQAKSSLNELRKANNDEIIAFAEKLAKESGITLSELKKLHLTKVLEHDNPLYEYYGIKNNEYIIEVKENSYEEISKCLGKMSVENIGFNVIRQDGESNYSQLEMIIEPSEKNKSALLVISLCNVDDEGEDFLNKNLKYNLKIDEYDSDNIKIDGNLSFTHKENKNLKPPFRLLNDYDFENYDYKTAVTFFNKFIKEVKEYEKLDGKSCILPSSENRSLDDCLFVMEACGAITCKNSGEDVYGNYNETGDSNNGYIHRELKENSKNYRAFRNVKSIEELQAVIDKIDKEVDLINQQYSKIIKNIKGELEYTDEKKISSIVEDIKSKAGINNSNGVKIGFAEKILYEPLEDIGYIYNPKTGDAELRNEDGAYELCTEIIVWKNGIVKSFDYTNDNYNDKWVTINMK